MLTANQIRRRKSLLPIIKVKRDGNRLIGPDYNFHQDGAKSYFWDAVDVQLKTFNNVPRTRSKNKRKSQKISLKSIQDAIDCFWSRIYEVEKNQRGLVKQILFMLERKKLSF